MNFGYEIYSIYDMVPDKEITRITEYVDMIDVERLRSKFEFGTSVRERTYNETTSVDKVFKYQTHLVFDKISIPIYCTPIPILPDHAYEKKAIAELKFGKSLLPYLETLCAKCSKYYIDSTYSNLWYQEEKHSYEYNVMQSTGVTVALYADNPNREFTIYDDITGWIQDFWEDPVLYPGNRSFNLMRDIRNKIQYAIKRELFSEELNTLKRDLVYHVLEYYLSHEPIANANYSEVDTIRCSYGAFEQSLCIYNGKYYAGDDRTYIY